MKGNLHLNIVCRSYSEEIQNALEPYVYELVGKWNGEDRMEAHKLTNDSVGSYNGSISAEHGIGQMKTHALHYSKDAVSRIWMKKLKNLFDERGIMNPGKVIDY